ncbi:MAG: hypothetical protein ACR2IQ_00630 [Minisyncoccia bacterium]
MIKKFSIVFSLILVMGGFWFGFHKTQKAHAQVLDKITGYAWSTNIGWIRMNCLNTLNDNTCGNVNYGVVADHDTGILSGYAWSSVVGWISFNSASGCPSVSYFNSDSNNYGDNCYARALFSYGSGGSNIVGWARVVAGPSGASCSNGACGEWISLSCLNSATSGNQNGYCNSSNHKTYYPDDGGPALNYNGGPISGYAYGSGVTGVGWLDLSRVIWNTSEDQLFCDLNPTDPSCLQDLYITTKNTPSSGHFEVGISPGIDLEYGSKNHIAFYDKCVASTNPVSTGTASWTGQKDILGNNNGWTYIENAVRVPYPVVSTGKVTYTITCPTDATNSISASMDVDVTVPTWTLSLTANGDTGSTTISNAGSVVLSWNTTNAPSGTTCSAPIWAPGSTGTSSTTNISSVTNSATYSVTCTPPAGVAYAKTASVQVKVVKVTSFPQISCFHVGDNPILSWSSQNANTCSINAVGSVISGLPVYSAGTPFTQGAGQYTLTCNDTVNNKTSGNNSISVTQCIPNFSIDSSMTCNGNPNANGGIITDNSFQKVTVKSGATYVAKIPVNISLYDGFNYDVSYTFLKPTTTAWNNISVKWASGTTGNTVVKTSSGGYADTLILTASSLSDMQALFTGVQNSYQGITIQAQRSNSTPTQLKPNPPVNNFSICAPGGGGIKPIFIES